MEIPISYKGIRKIPNRFQVIRTVLSPFPCTLSRRRRTIAIARSSDPALEECFAADSAKTTGQSNELQKKIESLLDTDEEKAIFKEFVEVRQAFIDARLAITKAKSDGQADEADTIFKNTFTPISQKYTGIMDRLLAEERRQIDATAQKVNANYEHGRMVLIIMSIIGLACGIGCTLVLTRGLLKQLGGEPAYAAEIANNIARGDLETAVKTKPDDRSSLLHAMAIMRESLAKIVAEVRAGADTIATASNQVASGNLDLSSRTEQQAGSLEETASSMEEPTSTVKQNADNARQANQLAVGASDVATRGGEVVSQVVDTMGSINEASKRSSISSM